ncbi:MAG: hypothetical protein KA275_03260 [Chitinophagaceae bacterium]|nr:hypothetical protein [Chitinophagaceae bacterium]
MKKIILVLSCIVLVWSCNQEKTEQNKTSSSTKDYRSERNQFSISYPANFEMEDSNTEYYQFLLLEPFKDSLDDTKDALMIGIETLPMAVPFKDLLASQKTAIKLQAPQVSFFDEEELKINGKESGRFVSNITAPDSTKFTIMSYMIYDSNRVFHVTVKNKQNEYAIKKPIFEDIIKSIKID